MATITPEQRDDVLKVVVGLFNAAPGGAYLSDLAAVVESGASTRQVADLLAAHPAFVNNVSAGKVTVADKVNLLMSNFGLTADSDPASPGSVAANYFKTSLEAKKGFGEIVTEAVEYLKNPAPEFKDVATLLNNKVLVAQAYSLNNSSTDLAVLQNVLGKVEGKAPYTDTDVKNILSGVTQSTLSLTVGEDNKTGTAGDDTFLASVVQNNAGTSVNTLESIDTLDGGQGNDTLTATISSDSPAPKLANIENVNLRFTAAKTVDLVNATGVSVVKVHDSAGVGTIDNVGKAETLAVANQKTDVIFNQSTATTLGLNLDAIPAKDDGTNDADVDFGGAKATTLNVTAKNANANVHNAGSTVATMSIAATGANQLTFTDDAGAATKVTVSGEGSVDLTGINFTGALTSFDASTNTGGIKAGFNSSKALTANGGDGADVYNFVGAVADSTASMGKGDDTLFVGSKLASLNKGADGGDGTDIINITDGTTLTSTNAKFITNFETLDVSGATASNFDVSLNSFATVQIDEAIAGALAGDIDFKNAPDTFVFNIASKAKTNANFDVVKNITVTGKDYAGTTAAGTAESFTLAATINDGNKDNAADGDINAQTITVPGVENLTIQAKVGTLDGGSSALKASKSTLTAKVVAADAETLTITGDASVDLSSVTTIGAVTKVNASGSTGDVKIDFSGHGKSVAYTGSEGVDTYKATATGDTIYTGKGADVINLKASIGAARDTFVLKAASDSQLTDTSKDGKITLTDTGFDDITAFEIGGTATTDRLDLTNFNFTGVQRGVENVTAIVANNTTDLTNIADLFSSVAGDRGVAYTSIGGSSYVFVDANKDGNFTAADDVVIKLTGVASISEVDINF
ncbi:MAG: hypothetical protein WAU15_12515 [Nitrosomonas sp.]